MSGVAPFSCGSQAMDWIENNCQRCKKSERADHDGPIDPTCDIEKALGEAFFSGVVSESIAVRMNALQTAYMWHCPEKDPRYAPAPCYNHILRRVQDVAPHKEK